MLLTIKIKINIKNFFKKINIFNPIGLILKSLKILKKKECKSLINMKILINFIFKIYYSIFINKYIYYLQLLGFNKNIYPYIIRSKLFKKINVNYILIKLQLSQSIFNLKKKKRIKKRIKKRLYSFENKYSN